MNVFHKGIGLFAIKYAPSVLALTCSIKIFLWVLSKSGGDYFSYSLNWINWGLNILCLLAFYSLGKAFGYCWKHRSLCRVAMWGYIYYGVFLLSNAPKSEVVNITIFYVCVVAFCTILYREIR